MNSEMIGLGEKHAVGQTTRNRLMGVAGNEGGDVRKLSR